MSCPSPELLDRIGVDKLATLPQATMRLLQTCTDENAEFSDISEIIIQDGGLTAKMLHAASSPLYAQWGEITDLNRMLVVLGLNTIKTIAITSSVLSYFSKPISGHAHLQAQFWYRSLFCAHIARMIAQKSGYFKPEEAYLAGLLHKIGQLVLINKDPARYEELLREYPDVLTLIAAETHTYGIDHLELGGWLGDKWQLGGFVSDAIRYQYDPPSSIQDAPEPVRIINLAAQLVDEDSRDSALENASKLLGLDQSILEECLKETQKIIKEAATALGVNIEPPPEKPMVKAVNSNEPAGLGELIRDTALLESVKSAMLEESSERDPHKTIQTFLAILFGLEDALFFMKAQDERLQGHSFEHAPQQLEQINIALESGRSILADTFLQKTILNTFQYQTPKVRINVVDRQLIRLCNRSGLLVIPLLTPMQCLGVMVIGVDASTLVALKPYAKLLELFAGEAAKLLQNRQDQQQKNVLILAEQKEQIMLNARKVRHEANNPLGIVSNYLHILGMKLGQDNPVQPELDIIRGEIDRVGKILLSLTDKMEQEDAPSGFTDVNALIRTLNGFLKPSLFQPGNISVNLELDATTPPIRADKNKIKQILINLFKNATEAMPDGGELLISTRDHLMNDEGRYVEISIKDNGPGLPESVRQHLFQPVKSKKSGNHSGLGLSITAQLARELKGRIQCRSNFRGTEFIITLPKEE